MQPFREKKPQKPLNTLPFTSVINPQIGLALAT